MVSKKKARKPKSAERDGMERIVASLLACRGFTIEELEQIVDAGGFEDLLYPQGRDYVG